MGFEFYTLGVRTPENENVPGPLNSLLLVTNGDSSRMLREAYDVCHRILKSFEFVNIITEVL